MTTACELQPDLEPISMGTIDLHQLDAFIDELRALLERFGPIDITGVLGEPSSRFFSNPA
jgi:hypothetical protein